jgi:small subunit ribosomal protein S27e
VAKHTSVPDGVQADSNSRSKTMAGNFYKVQCPDCENEQTVFGKAASEVNCVVCGHKLATPTGGKAEIDGDVVETIASR